MSDYKTVISVCRPDFVKRLHVVRIQEQGELHVSVEFTVGSEIKSVTLTGYDELADSITDLISAERFVLSKELGTGREFGTCRIEIWIDDCYSEYWCDSINET